MNCADVRDGLPAFLYGDLVAEARVPIQEHLTTCDACRRELAALRQLRQVLNRIPVPKVDVDLPLLYHQAAAQQERRMRRWRRLAGGLVALAAGLGFIAFGLHLELRLEAHQVVLRWGTPPPSPEPVSRATGAQAALASARPVSSPTEEQLQLLGDLVRALAEDVALRDQRQQQQLASVQLRLQEWQRLTAQRWRAAEQDLAALYAAHLLVSKKEGHP